jgi:hypothetical protein
LSSLAMYMMSFFEVPKGILKKLDLYWSNFFWQGNNHKKKYRLTKWGILCLPKEQGGLGIFLLSKWLFKLINEDGVWQELLRKYLKIKQLVKFVGSQEIHISGQALWRLKTIFWNLLLSIFIMVN